MHPDLIHVRDTCRVCGSTSLRPVFDLGPQYIAGAFLRHDEDRLKGNEPFAQRYPLELVRCDPQASHGACGLVQLKHTLSREVLFQHYGYRSGVNQTMRDHLVDIASKAEALTGVRRGDTVLDVGCNDGTLLLAYATDGLDRLGIDPADDVTRYARERGLQVVDEFFSDDTFERARPGRRARIVTSIAMFYDLEDPASFVRAVAQILADDGLWVLEVGWIVAMLQMNAFDAVCHEHLEYYGLAQLEALLGPAGLSVQSIETNTINGGSLCLFIRKAEACRRSADDVRCLEEVRAQESALGLATDRPFALFRKAAETIREELVRMLRDIKRRGERVYVYGASTKGNVILQYCGLDRSVIPAAADRNPDKWGHEMLGTGIPIISEEQARAEGPEYFLVLPYHFLDEFRLREARYLKDGGKFIVPMPKVKMVEA